MADQMNFRLRIFFRKAERLSMLSHLELARALERVIRRADLPYAISQGFSPHMKIAFGAALPVGVGGERECFDLQLTQYVAPEKALSAMQSATVDDLAILSCEYISNKVPAASVAYPVSTYEAVLSQAPASPLVVPETVLVTRKGKERQLIVGEFLKGGICVEGRSLTFTLCAKPTGSLRADIFVRALLASTENIKAVSLTRKSQSAF